MAGTLVRRNILIRGIAIALGVAVLAGVVKIRIHDVITSGAQAVWNQEELYVFVEQNKVGWSESVWSFASQVIKGAFGVATPPTFKRIDCLVYRITKDTVERRTAKGWHVAGTIAPFRGSLYAFVGGGSPGGGVFRWDGENFLRLSASDAESLQQSFTYRDDLFAREGWSQIPALLPGSRPARHSITLTGIPFTINASQTEDGTSTIELVNEQAHSAQTIYQFKNEPGFMGSGAYRHLVE